MPRKRLRMLQVASNQSQNGLTRPLTRRESLEQQSSVDDLKKAIAPEVQKDVQQQDEPKEKKRTTNLATVQRKKRLLRQKTSVASETDQNDVEQPKQQVKPKLRKQVSKPDSQLEPNATKDSSTARPSFVSKKSKKLTVTKETQQSKLAASPPQVTPERVINWLTSEGPITDAEYWRMMAFDQEELLQELKKKSAQERSQLMNHLDELQLENELLIEEHRQLTKLAEKAFRLRKVLQDLGIDCQTDWTCALFCDFLFSVFSRRCCWSHQFFF